MKKFLVALIALTALAVPCYASHTECRVLKETDRLDRPGGIAAFRGHSTLEKGETVSVLDTYPDAAAWHAGRGWAFVLHYYAEEPEYGWVERRVLGGCRVAEGTP